MAHRLDPAWLEKIEELRPQLEAIEAEKSTPRSYEGEPISYRGSEEWFQSDAASAPERIESAPQTQVDSSDGYTEQLEAFLERTGNGQASEETQQTVSIARADGSQSYAEQLEAFLERAGDLQEPKPESDPISYPGSEQWFQSRATSHAERVAPVTQTKWNSKRDGFWGTGMVVAVLALLPLGGLVTVPAAMLIRKLYVNGTDKPFWSLWILVMAVGMSLILWLGALGAALERTN